MVSQRRLAILAAVLALCALWVRTPQSRAWFDQVENWDHLYIAYVNGVDVMPTYVSGGWSNATLDGYNDYLTAYYELDDDGTWADSTTNGYDLTDSGGIINATSGPAPDCADGNGTDWLSHADNSDFSPASDVILSVWAKLPAVTDVGLCGKHRSYLLYHSSSSGWTFDVYAATQKTAAFAGAQDTNWHHVAGFAVNGVVRVYVDGVLGGTTGTYSAGINDANEDFEVCRAYPFLTYTLNSEYTDEVAVWTDTGMTASETAAFAAALYNGGSGTFYAANAATAGEAGTLSGHLTVRARSEKQSGGADLTELYLQYRDGGGTWHTVDEHLNTSPPDGIECGTVEVEPDECAFGVNSVTTGGGHYALGAAFRVRLYATDGIYECADVADDTTEDGGNGWLDQWVVGGTMHATNTKPARATFRFGGN